MAINNADSAILFQSKVSYARLLINNVNTLGVDTTKDLEEIEKISNNIQSKVKASSGVEMLAGKMTAEGAYLEAITNIDKIIVSLERHIVGFQIRNNCEYVSKIQNISSSELKDVVDNLISSLKSLKKSDPSFVVDYSVLVLDLYEAIYRVMKLEYMVSGFVSSILFDYVSKDMASRSFISTLIVKDVNSLRNEAADLTKIDGLISRARENAFDDVYYFNEDVIKEIIKIKHKEELVVILKNTVGKLRERYDENFSKTIDCYKKIESNDKKIDSVKKALKETHKRKIKDISSSVVSSVLSVSVLGMLLVGPYFIKNKKVKTTITITNSLSDEIDVSDEYLTEDKEGNTIYLEMYDPWVKDENGNYVRDVYKYELPYEEYVNRDIMDVIDYDNLNVLVNDVGAVSEEKEVIDELDLDAFYSDPWFRFVKREQNVDDIKYERTVKDNLTFILFGNFLCIQHLIDLVKEYEKNKSDNNYRLHLLSGIRNSVLWLKKQRNTVWSDETFKEYEKRISVLLKDQDDLRRTFEMFKAENDEIEKMLSAMLEEPAISEIIKELNLNWETDDGILPKDKMEKGKVLKKEY